MVDQRNMGRFKNARFFFNVIINWEAKFWLEELERKKMTGNCKKKIQILIFHESCQLDIWLSYFLLTTTEQLHRHESAFVNFMNG